MGGRSLKVKFKETFKLLPPTLKNEGYADQLKDNRTVKECRKKKVFTLF